MKQVTAVLLGAGDRGAHAYGDYAMDNPNEVKFVAVADPDPSRRGNFADNHGIPVNHRYNSWEEVLNQSKLADVMVICMQDRMHFQPTIQALSAGYHILLEKPMSPNPKECVEMVQAAEKNRRLLSICHVLRYSPFWSSLKKRINRGDIGEVVSIQLNENVGYLHMAHSFVRGNWRNSDLSSPMILQKSCHDMDILSWLIDRPCKYVSSFGSLKFFREENAPEGSTSFCLDGCAVAAKCPFYAPRFYLNEQKWAKKITDDSSREGIIEALKDGPYGKCVYQTDNNVVDHQVVNLEFRGGATATFSMSGLTHDMNRTVKIMGTEGDIEGDMENNTFTVHDFLTKEESEVNVHTSTSDHGGGDTELMRNFIQEIHRYDNMNEQGLTSAEGSLQSHMIAFAAEESRVANGKSMDLDQFYSELKLSMD